MTDLPYWNLSDNDFVFAEPGAPLGGSARELRYGFVRAAKKKSPVKRGAGEGGAAGFYSLLGRIRSDRYARRKETTERNESWRDAAPPLMRVNKPQTSGSTAPNM